MSSVRMPINKKAYLVNALFYVRAARSTMRGKAWIEAKSWLNDAESDIVQTIKAIDKMPTVVK